LTRRVPICRYALVGAPDRAFGRSRESDREFGVPVGVFARTRRVNGLLLAGVTRKGQDAELAAYGRFVAVSTATNVLPTGFLWPYLSFRKTIACF
jgi:hypothetical protein